MSSPLQLTNDIDKMTLEFLTNKTQYQRYLSKIDPKKNKEHLDYLSAVQNYRRKILDMTCDFLDDPDKMVTLEINEGVEAYFKTMIKYFEIRDLEVSRVNEEEDEHEDVLFGTIEEPTAQLSKPLTSSFWGKKVKKTSEPEFN